MVFKMFIVINYFVSYPAIHNKHNKYKIYSWIIYKFQLILTYLFRNY